ncbi:MAG: Hsp33 family molecular chaperone HslO [Halieaceae bacterium]|nr:Hsp33 family molecular chaperone HslO [Halieaceae bacterium]
MSTERNLTRKFIFEEADIRGEIVHLDSAYRDILAIHAYPAGVARQLGEFLAAAVLLSTTIKFEGRLILQAQGDGELPLLMAECNNNLEVRAIARGAETATASEFTALFGSGHLAITIEPNEGQRYQGIVPLDSGSLAGCIESYFENSEQLATRLWLASDGEVASGLLLQQLPEQVTQDAVVRAGQWEHACTLAETVERAEVLELEQETLLYRLFHEDKVRLFAGELVRFACSCSWERCHNALLSIGPTELLKLLDEEPEIKMDCEFCNAQYRFQRPDFTAQLGDATSGALH